MLRVSIIDANEKAAKVKGVADDGWISSITSMVGHWLRYEIEQAGIALHEPAVADIILLTHAGAIDYLDNCRRALKRNGIEWRSEKRERRPYVVAGGAVDTIPFTAVQIVDCVAIGEGYRFLRTLLGMVKAGCRLEEVIEWVTGYEHAVERGQLVEIDRDPDRPWLLREPVVLARPDTYIDWSSPPPVRTEDNVVRLLGSKGCGLKCKFCANTYRQPFQKNPNDEEILERVGALTAAGHRVAIVTNDMTGLPYADRLPAYGNLDNQSITIKGVRDPRRLESIIRSRLKIVRWGVEGMSERLRVAIGKPIGNAELMGIIGKLQENSCSIGMYYVVGMPFETADDWMEYREFHDKLACGVIKWGMNRIKYTSFIPAAPAPLARFIPSPAVYVRELSLFREWLGANASNRHITTVWPRLAASQLASFGKLLGVSLETVKMMTADGGTFDLAPAEDDASRLPWEIIAWPQTTAQRWKLGEVYKKHMAGEKGANG